MREKLRDFVPRAAPARATSSTYNAAFTMLLTVTLAIGEYFRGFRLDADVTVTATGTGTSYLADLIKKITVTNEYGEVVFIADGNAGPGIAALFAALLNADEIRNSFTKKVVADGTGAVSYNAWWEILQSARGRVFDFSVEFYSPLATLAGFTAGTLSACASSMGVTVYTSDEPGEQIKIEVDSRLNPQKITEDDGFAYMLAVDNAELSTKLSTLSMDDKALTDEQLKALENTTAKWMEGFGSAGSEGAVQYIPGVLSPNSANQLYAAAVVSENVQKIDANVKAAATIYVAKAIPAPVQDVVVMA